MSTNTENATGIYADYVNGENARLRRVRLEVEGVAPWGHLKISLADHQEPLVWPLADLRLIPDQADKSSVIIGRVGDHPARIRITDKEMSARLAALCPDLRRRNKNPKIFRKLILLASGATASVLLIIFVLIPTMANQLAGWLPLEGEIALGDATYDNIRHALNQNNSLGLRECNAPQGVAALEKLAARLTPGHDFPYRLKLHVLDHKMINAFALPGGHIVTFRGLLEDAHSAEEVAGVLGHEMGHVIHRDPTRLALRSAGSVGVLGLLLGDFAGGAAILYLSEQLVQSNYSRGAETASDKFAHQVLAEAGLPSAPMADFFLRLKDKYGDATGFMTHLASHPDLDGRARAARAADTVGVSFQPILSPSEWLSLRNICN